MFTRLLGSAAVTTALLFPLASHAQDTSRYSAALSALIADIETADMKANPIEAGQNGDKAAARKLADVSLDTAKKRNQMNTVFMARHRSLPASGLSPEERLNYDLIGFVLYQRSLQAPLDSARVPFTNDGGFYSGLTYVARNTRLESPQSYADYIARLSEVPRYFEQHIENMRRGIKTGHTAPAEIVPQVITGIENLAAIAVEDHPLAAPFKNVNPRLPEDVRKKIRYDGLVMIDDEVMPAYRKLLGFMETEYLPKARPNVGLSTVPGGKAQYEALTKYYTTLDITPDEVHAIGQREVARIRTEMDAVIIESGFKGTFAEFLNFLRTDPQFYVTKREDLLKEAAWIAKRIDGVMPEYFGTLPRLSYGVIPVPREIEENYTTGRYFNGNAKAGKAGNYVVNTYDLKQRPLYNLPALTLHEGVPGHHHQISLNSEQENVPQFRQNLYPHAFGEGWGLYAEKLGKEMGIYRTPYEDFGRLTYEMWRACRLVMDTGMHYKGWSREKAENCLYENSALAPHNIKTETDRYISWPGQALAYKMGELKILELRALAEKELGEDFDIREFHDAVLVDGALPLKILDAKVKGWIAAEKTTQKN